LPAPPDPGVVSTDVRRALAEDIGSGDLTADLVPAGTHLHTRVICRETAVLAGCAWFDETFAQLSGEVAIRWACQDGDTLRANQEICRLEGDAAALLSGERTALNFIQTLSATATAAAEFVRAIAGTRARILDTRKTLPGLRQAQKYAVRCGGASNHRIGLFDAILIKENHISAAGTISAAVATARARHPDVLIEVEVENLPQLRETIDAGAQRALLDNFSLQQLREGVAMAGGAIELEASGNVTLDSVREIAGTGVDFISTGAITKHVRAVDFSMRYID
jgi:nicotinate-nucleotide pyrophosphorylase (carboxylating)